MGEGQFTDAMAQQTALWHIALRDQAVGLTHAACSLAAVTRDSHGGMKAPALQVGHISACGRVLYHGVRCDQLVVDASVVVSAMITSSIAARG
jgi:hypothetical protein